MNRPTFVVADNTYKRTTILIQNRTEAVNCGLVVGNGSRQIPAVGGYRAENAGNLGNSRARRWEQTGGDHFRRWAEHAVTINLGQMRQDCGVSRSSPHRPVVNSGGGIQHGSEYGWVREQRSGGSAD
ncbi:Uncharacterized protein Fot_34790 [Forsythia ovata]|uniref:Uncharacterized protein n=1 Tax=Forsythia ovata TaxID=205694 RepID=A0ABD1SJP4_9LAMI